MHSASAVQIAESTVGFPEKTKEIFAAKPWAFPDSRAFPGAVENMSAVHSCEFKRVESADKRSRGVDCAVYPMQKRASATFFPDFIYIWCLIFNGDGESFNRLAGGHSNCMRLFP